ncbi:hypothetical protein SAMN04487910_1400 [Aquimarina amphilecti]|uniref:Uncharacterized protein n=1 Tax=Aquimarina amphilecti TaxID=1038014 RepID=A0A1H7KQI3_AQUAM|nr:hypothetical protein [Aquimarina amphilecti]SEK88998.1 hypothetical protein SAMN04487910_1400 [Aquimarina amphilecti]
MTELNLNELMTINGGTDDCNSDAYNNGHAVGEVIGEVIHVVADFFRGLNDAMDG